MLNAHAGLQGRAHSRAKAALPTDNRQIFREHALPMVLVLSVALLCAQLSVRLRANILSVAFGGELGTFIGRPLYQEFQNRILSPGMLVVLHKIFPAGVSDKSVWFTLCALAAVFLMGFAYAWTPLSHPWEYQRLPRPWTVEQKGPLLAAVGCAVIT